MSAIKIIAIGIVTAAIIYFIIKGLIIFSKAGMDFGHKMPKSKVKKQRGK